jgi:hypothetical protein
MEWAFCRVIGVEFVSAGRRPPLNRAYISDSKSLPDCYPAQHRYHGPVVVIRMPMGAQDLFWVPDCNGIAKPFEDDSTLAEMKLAQPRGVEPGSKSNQLHPRRAQAGHSSKPLVFKSMPNSTTLVVNVGIDPEALRRPRQLVVRRHVTNRAGRTGAAATAGVGTVPRLVWMVRAHPAAIIAEDTFHDKPNRDSYETFQFGTSAAGWKVRPRRNELPLRQIIRLPAAPESNCYQFHLHAL